MRSILIMTMILSILTADDKLVANIEKTLQKVTWANQERSIENIKVSYDPFNSNRAKKTINSEMKTPNSKVVKTAKHSTEPVLSMIFNKKAFINGKWYKENEKFADYRITRIDQDIVVLKKNNKYTTLKLPVSDMIIVTKEEIE